jgi:hypothetical protein
MRGFDEFEPDARRRGKASRKYMVCVGGYPRDSAPTFVEAEARAWDLLLSEPDGDFSIYEVATGIHFNAPQRPRLDEGLMPGVFDSYFDCLNEMR